MCSGSWFSEVQTEVLFLSQTLFGAIPATLSSAREVGGGISRPKQHKYFLYFVQYKTLWSCCLALSQAGIDLLLTLKCYGCNGENKTSHRKYCLSPADWQGTEMASRLVKLSCSFSCGKLDL